MAKQLDGEDLRHLFACTFVFHFAVYMVLPAITDVTMDALCPGQDHCSLAIYLSGVHQAVSGLGALVVTPLVGKWSDKYGRKALLSLPMTAAIIPLVILSSGRSKPHFYTYYVVKMLTTMFCEGSMQCLTLAYVADRVCEGKRASAFGVLSGISLAGFVSGTLVARFLPTSYTFQVSASVAGFAALYMKIFLAETDGGASLADEESTLPLCSGEDESSLPKLPALRNIPASSDMITFLRSSITLTRAATVAFFTNLANSGYQAVLLYYLKAKFQFNKDQFADLMLIVGSLGATSQLLLMPLLAPVIGEERLLIIGLLASCTHIFLYGVAWSYWVPYFAAAFAALSVLVDPSLRSIVSKKVGPAEQGMAQGCVTGVASFASILAPFVFTPLTALFLSDNAPFSFKGFSVTCAGFVSLVAFSLSMTLISKKTRSTILHSPSGKNNVPTCIMQCNTS